MGLSGVEHLQPEEFKPQIVIMHQSAVRLPVDNLFTMRGNTYNVDPDISNAVLLSQQPYGAQLNSHETG